MALMDKFLNYMKLNDDEIDDEYYDEEDEFYDDEDGFEEKAPVHKVFSKAAAAADDDDEPAPQLSAKVTPLRAAVSPRRSANNNSGMEVCVIKPTSIEDAREITDTLRSGRAVVLNLEGLDVDIAQRIIDFSSGSSYAIDGKLQKISHYIFILTPRSVDISGDFQDAISGSLDVPSGQRPVRRY